MTKRTQKHLVRALAILLVMCCAIALMFWVVPNLEMSSVWIVWWSIYLALFFTPFGGKLFEKIVGVKDWYRGVAMINAIIASVMVSLVWSSIYLFRTFF